VSEITNLFGVIDQIVARLRVTLGADHVVEKMAEFADLEFSQWPAPAVYVISGQIVPSDPVADWVQLELTIHVVVVVDNAYTISDQGGPDHQAGTIALNVIRQLHNWMPADHDPLVLVPGNAVDFAPGRLLVPLSFKTGTTVTGFYDPNH